MQHVHEYATEVIDAIGLGAAARVVWIDPMSPARSSPVAPGSADPIGVDDVHPGAYHKLQKDLQRFEDSAGVAEFDMAEYDEFGQFTRWEPHELAGENAMNGAVDGVLQIQDDHSKSNMKSYIDEHFSVEGISDSLEQQIRDRLLSDLTETFDLT